MSADECTECALPGSDLDLAWYHLPDGRNLLLCDDCAVDLGARFRAVKI